MVCEWWKAWGWQPVEESSLSTVGMIVSIDGVDACTAWLVCTDTDTCLIEWYVSNKQARKHRKEALHLLVEALSDVARKRGYRKAVSMVNNRNLIRKLREIGFAGQESAITLIRGL